MSDIGTVIRESALAGLDGLTGTLAEDFTGGLSAVLEGASAAAKNKVAGLVSDGYHFKKMALTADNAEDAREYAEAAAKAQRRIKTVLLAEAIVAKEETAQLVSDLFGKALDGLATIAKGLVTTIAAGVVKGAVAGFIGGEGGDGFDPSSLFPFG